MHGYSHENPIAMTPEQEEAVLVKCIGLIEEVSGRRPTGYVAPWWEFSTVTNELLLKHGIKYDHSLMHRDFHPYYVRVGDSWTKIDYSKQPDEWMKPLVRGEETDLIEIPASWHLDDLPPMMFIKAAPNSHGFVNPRHLEELWRDQFDYIYREEDYAVFAMTVHPDVAGRPQVILMLERLIEHISGHDGVRWATMDEIADDFAQRYPRGGSERPVTSHKARKYEALRLGGDRSGVAAGELEQHARLRPGEVAGEDRAGLGEVATAAAPVDRLDSALGAPRADDDRTPAATASRTPSTTCSFALPRPVPSSTIARAPAATAARRKRASLPACRRIRSTGTSSAGRGSGGRRSGRRANTTRSPSTSPIGP